MKKKYLLLTIIVLFIICNNIFAVGVSKKTIRTFFQSTTYVVLGNSMIEDAQLKAAVEKYWTITKFKFIGKDEFEIRKINSNASFLYFSEGEYVRNKGSKYKFLTLEMGDSTMADTTGIGDDTTAVVFDVPVLCSFPLEYSTDDNNRYGYLLNSVVLFMQQNMRMYKEKYFLIKTLKLNYYHRNFKLVKGKQLLASPDDIAKEIRDTLFFTNTIFSDVKFLFHNKIEEEIETSKEKDILVLFCVRPDDVNENIGGHCFKMIIDPADGTLYYFNVSIITQKSSSGFDQSDLTKFIIRE